MNRQVDHRTPEEKRKGIPRFARRHFAAAEAAVTRRERKARARINGLAERKGASIRWAR